ncbi:MAG: ABC transporter permease [Thermodesulfobacteriota bacterium]
MPEALQTPTARLQVDDDAGGGITIHISGALTIDSRQSLSTDLQKILQRGRGACPIRLDLSDITSVDDFGVLTVENFKATALQKGCQVVVTQVTGQAQRLFQLFSGITSLETEPSGVSTGHGLLDVIPEVGNTVIGGIKKVDSSIAFVGSVLFAFIRAVLSPRSFRLGDTIELMKKDGVDGIPIIGLIGTIIGLITAFVSSVQLEKLGGNIYIPAMITFAMVAEIGPMMTAIVIAGRTGSAYAAEIGTMKISEEIDALTSMGFDPTLFLAVPRIVALVIVLPILTVCSVIFALLGGLAVCVTLLNLQMGPYLEGVSDALFIDDVVWALAKSCIFAILIAVIGCLRGFQVRGGAASVGSAATSSVVTGIFFIILADSVVALIRLYWG